MTGTIKRIVNKEKRFTFISGTHMEDHFVHGDDLINITWEQLVMSASNGNSPTVEFDSEKTEKGYRARNVRLL